jgi:AcrR family transcriptional regulator
MPPVADTDPATSRAEQRRRTEARILDAASRMFVESGYERTTIRAVAGAAGVDAGLVMHYFGTKQALFGQVTHASPPQALAGPPGEVSEQILARLAESLATEPAHSLAVLRSMLTHPEAAQAARQGVASYQAQISASIPAADAGVRAALVSAVVLGVVVSRHLLKSEGITNATPEQIIDLLRPCLHSLTRADPGLPGGGVDA